MSPELKGHILVVIDVYHIVVMHFTIVLFDCIAMAKG